MKEYFTFIRRKSIPCEIYTTDGVFSAFTVVYVDKSFVKIETDKAKFVIPYSSIVTVKELV